MSSGSQTDALPLLVYMSPPARLLERLEERDDLPRWFAHPIMKAGFRVRFREPGVSGGRQAHRLLRDGPLAQLFFSIGPGEVWAGLRLHRRAPVCTLYQSWPLDVMPLHKRLAYRLVFRRSAVIVVYDAISEHYVRIRFPDKPVVRLGLFVDTDYFTPGQRDPDCEPFVLCPGNHRRDERLIVEIARRLDVPVVRMFYSERVRRYYRENVHGNVALEDNVPFERVRTLYRDALAVMNVADDRFWPVGITTFCEALAMNKAIVTTAGHCSAGYEFPDGMRPYLTVKRHDDVGEWVGQMKVALNGGLAFEDGRSPCDLALAMCSEAAAVATWGRVKELLGSRARTGT